MSIPGFLGGVGIGAALMYFLDPGGGRQRRAQVRAKASHLADDARAKLSRGRREVKERVGAVEERARAMMEGADDRLADRLADDEAADDALEQRVRAALGAVATQPRSIAILVDGGRVELEGLVSASEHVRVVAAVRAVEGVEEVGDYLEDVEEPDTRPGLGG